MPPGLETGEPGPVWRCQRDACAHEVAVDWVRGEHQARLARRLLVGVWTRMLVRQGRRGSGARRRAEPREISISSSPQQRMARSVGPAGEGATSTSDLSDAVSQSPRKPARATTHQHAAGGDEHTPERNHPEVFLGCGGGVGFGRELVSAASGAATGGRRSGEHGPRRAPSPAGPTPAHGSLLCGTRWRSR